MTGQRPQTPRRQQTRQRPQTPNPQPQGHRTDSPGAGGQQRPQKPGSEGGRQQRPQAPKPQGQGERPSRPRFQQPSQRPQGQTSPKPATQQRPQEPGPRIKYSQVPQALKTSIEVASELAKKELSFRGKIGSMAVFVYPDIGAAPEGASDQGETVRTVTLSNRNELQKEAVRKRIREKVAAEAISAVILMMDGKKERPSRVPSNQPTVAGSFVITGVTPSAGASASVAYSFDKITKAFTAWDFRWLDSFVDDYFLQNVFGTDSANTTSGGRHRRNG